MMKKTYENDTLTSQVFQKRQKRRRSKHQINRPPTKLIVVFYNFELF